MLIHNPNKWGIEHNMHQAAKYDIEVVLASAAGYRHGRLSPDRAEELGISPDPPRRTDSGYEGLQALQRRMRVHRRGPISLT